MTPRREVLSDGVEMWLGDCAQVMPLLSRVEAVVTDPPYGLGEARSNNRSRTSGLSGKLAGTKRDGYYNRDKYGDADWDDKPLGPTLLAAVLAAARWHIIFGGNYFLLPPTTCWLVWDKINGTTCFADCELAWTNLPKAARLMHYLWNGCMREERDVEREHPTQKPVGVMKWAISHLPDPRGTILDPFAGTGTTGVAAVQTGWRFIGIERDERYFAIACRRISKALEQPDLFFDSVDDAPVQPQLRLLA
jgi:site-specific DNA-methyltransferase (adenine-specific)/modification methylase